MIYPRYAFGMLLTGSILFTASCSQEPKTAEDSSPQTPHTLQSDLLAGQEAMRKELAQERPTNNSSHDVARLLLIHHHQVLALARAEASGGSDAKLRQLALQLQQTQEREIHSLQELDKELEKGQVNYSERDNYDPFAKEIKEILDVMLQGVPRLTGQHDADFVALMLLHTRAGLKLAQSALEHSSHLPLLVLAREMRRARLQELDQLTAWQHSTKAGQ